MGLHVVLIVCLVMAVVGMVNFLSRDFFVRFNWSPHGKIELAPLTVSFLRSLTNQVKVIVYYDKKDTFYSTIADLLNQYQLTNPKISVDTVDYLLDAGAAQKVSRDYKLSSASDKNLSRQPITLSYAEQAEGPWAPIAANLENSGRYVWPMPLNLPFRIFVKVEAADRAGNVNSAQTANPILVDLSKPKVNITTVEPRQQ